MLVAGTSARAAVGRVTRTAGPASQTLKLAISGFGNTRVKVGYFPEAKYPDGTPVAYVATIQEFGHAPSGIPPRPTMRPTVEAQRTAWVRHAEAGARAVARGAIAPAQVLDSLGLLAAGDLRQTIANLQSPPLKQSTIDARRRTYADTGTTGNLAKPLVATALMVNSVSHEVEGGDG